MKIRGWLLLAAVVLSAQCAMAASPSVTVTNITDGALPVGADGYTVDAVTQQAVVNAVGAVTGNAAVAQTQLVGASKGTLINATNQIFGITNAGTGTATQMATGDALTTIFNDAAVNGNGGALSVVSGTYALGGATAGAATVGAIGGGGGVIAGRQSALIAERKSMGNVDSALASFNMNKNFANRIWASPFYTHQDMDQKDGYEGYKYSAWGASLGYDRAFGSFFVGAAFTYSRGDYDTKNVSDDNTIDNYGFSLYGQYYNSCNGFFATLAGGYNYGDNEWKTNTAAGRLTGDNHTDSYWIGGNIGKDFFLGENWTVTPSIGLFWSEAESSAYSARFANGNFQNFSKTKSKSLMMPIDLKLEYTQALSDCSSISFNVNGGYAYNWKKDGGRAKGSFNYAGYENNVIFLQGVKPGRSSWNAGAGVTYRVNNLDVGVNYRYDGKSKFDAHRVAATVGWSF